VRAHLGTFGWQVFILANKALPKRPLPENEAGTYKGAGCRLTKALANPGICRLRQAWTLLAGSGACAGAGNACHEVKASLLTRPVTRTLPIFGSPLTQKEPVMPKFVIEREIPGLGALKAAELQSVSQKSCDVLQSLGTDVQWVQSYLTGDKMYCIYNAASEELVREHARRGGFPANTVARVTGIIDPTTAEA
jgi:hypothetical protein